MPRTWVARTDVVEGKLPPVCVRSGQSTDHGRRIAVQPGAARGAGLFAGLAGLGLSTGDRLRGAVPMRPTASAQLSRLQQVRTWAAVAGAVLIVLGLVVELTVLTVLGVLALVVAVVWTMLALNLAVTGHLDDSGDWVELRGVHPGFVAAADQRYGEEER